VGVGLFSQVTSNRTCGNGLKLHQERFRLSIRKNFSLKRFSLEKVIFTGTGCPGKQLRHHPWRYLKDIQMQSLATWFNGRIDS